MCLDGDLLVKQARRPVKNSMRRIYKVTWEHRGQAAYIITSLILGKNVFLALRIWSSGKVLSHIA
jgi:hypothetical protein